MANTVVFALLFTAAIALGAKVGKVNNHPIIGILTEPNDENDPTQGSFLVASYVKWAEMAGSRVVPIPYDASQQELDYLFGSINGIIFTGGGLDLSQGNTYFDTAQYLFRLAMKANDAGDYFPMWGTCMGFQLLNILGAGFTNSTLLLPFDTWGIALPLIFNDNIANSRLLGGAPSYVLHAFSTENITMNWHHWGVAPSEYQKYHQLNNFYDILATNYDPKGREFVSLVEGKRSPFYASQFHPEMDLVEWDECPIAGWDHTIHTFDAIRSMQYLGDFFVNEARNSQHKFPNQTELRNHLIYNYPVTYSVDKECDEQTYYFPYKH